MADLVAVMIVSSSARIVRQEPRYLYTVLADPITGAVDDVEFFFSLDRPIVGYRAQPRAGQDDAGSRNRIRLLTPAGWQSDEYAVELS